MGGAPRGWVRVCASLALVLATWAGVLLINLAVSRVKREVEDVVSETDKPAHHAQAEAPAKTRHPAFVLLVDSLRAQSAASSLPSLQALRARGLFVDVLATQDASTVPSLRAAFTGRATRSFFTFARDFIHGHEVSASIFSQIAEGGGRSAVFSDGKFYEFAHSIETLTSNEEPPGDTEEEREVSAFHHALALFHEGKHALVVFHFTTVDHVAHTRGIDNPTYRHVFSVVDELIREADAAVPASATFVVMSDHGHDERGLHFPGLHVPTVALYRGPGFAPGTTLGPVPLTTHRYLLGWALGLPLSEEYRGAGAAEVLKGAPKLRKKYAKPLAVVSDVPMQGARGFWLLPLVLGLAIGATFTARLLSPGALQGFRNGLIAILAAFFFVGWGYLLFKRRLSTLPPFTTEILTWWCCACAVGAAAVASGLVARMKATWALLALPALFLYPTAAWDSWAAIMGPAWLTGIVLMLADWTRRRFTASGERQALTRAEQLALASLPGLAALLLPFFYAQADSIESGAWRGYLTSDRAIYWIAISTAARLVIFVRPRGGPRSNVVALGIVALLSLVSFGEILPTQSERLIAAAALGAAALIARRLSWSDVSRMLANGALLLAYRGSVLLEERSLLQLELLLAALRLTALATTALERPEDGRSSGTWLEALALLVATWTTLALRLHRLEWTLLYRFFDPRAIEAGVGLALPFIACRYALPLILARRLLAEARPAAIADTWRAAYAVAATRSATLLLIAAGYAILDPTSELFLAAVQCVLTFSVLGLAYVSNPAAASSLATVPQPLAEGAAARKCSTRAGLMRSLSRALIRARAR
jgi:hypothetical protein